MLNIFKPNKSLTTKMLIAYLWIAIILAGVFIGARTALAASLKNVSIVTSDVLTVRDLFDGVTNNADYVIGKSPHPGEDMVLNARTLYRIAISLDLPWRPTNSTDSVTVRREATIIPYESIEEKIRHSLSSEGVSGLYDLNVNTGRPEMILPKEIGENIEVDRFTFNPQSNIFHAAIVAPSIANPVKTIKLSGSIERIIEVPVLKTALRNGDIIGKRDINWVKMPERKLQSNLLMRESDLIGQTPRRIAHAGKPLVSNELEAPQLVGRGENVTISFVDGPLVLTTKGKALQSGAKGDLIRVNNLNSNRTVDAYVTSENAVVVQ